VHNRPAEGAVNKLLLLHKADAVHAVEALKQAAVDRDKVAAVDRDRVAAVEALKHTLLRQAPETFARSSLTGAGIWACCAARRKSI
jgi:hypothetical protein